MPCCLFAWPSGWARWWWFARCRLLPTPAPSMLWSGQLQKRWKKFHDLKNDPAYRCLLQISWEVLKWDFFLSWTISQLEFATGAMLTNHRWTLRRESAKEWVCVCVREGERERKRERVRERECVRESENERELGKMFCKIERRVDVMMVTKVVRNVTWSKLVRFQISSHHNSLLTERWVKSLEWS